MSSNQDATKPDELRYSFGRVAEGTRLSHEFTIYNHSQSPVTVYRVTTSCSCTTAEPTVNPIPGKGKAGLTVYVDTRSKSGPIIETIYVALSDGSTHQFTAEALVEGSQVASLDFGEVLRGDTGKVRSFDVRWPGTEPLQVTSVSYDSGCLVVRHTSDPERKLEHFVVSLTKEIPWGSFGKEIVLRTNDLLTPWKSIPVFGTVLYPVATDPQQVLLGEFRQNDRKSGSVRVFSPYSLPLSIEKCEVVEGKAAELNFTKTSESEQRLELVIDESEYPGEQIIKVVFNSTARVGGAPHQITVDAYGLRAEGKA